MGEFFTFFRILLFIVISTEHFYAQDVNQQLAITLSNDKFADDDKYFTNGLYITYQKAVAQNFIFPKTDGNKLQLNIGIGNEIYSPASLSSTNTDDFDRPFAGWLFGKLEVGSIKKKSAFFLAFETGITGEESLAGDFQVGLHNVFGIDSRPTWVEQIGFKWLFNLKITHVFDWSNQRNAFQYRISPSLGTKDIYLENDISYFFGRLNTFQNSSRTTIVDNSSSKEFYGYVSAGYRYVAHNTLIQGSIFTDDVLFTTDITNHIFKTEIGAILQVKRNTFKIAYNFNTKETPLSTSHIYGSLFYARSF
ncbi:lipid A-modifier LpxR family protein [Maribacter algarum]|uniref:lipid A-modifier LpxR family protein n=1 Tax=Maribacter algarum (ex Zhang et al. 2020) TaxID=2578118 RepID=UPI001486AB8D|nr:lipid A-modifier LpxR family protein [Maribacter algarum]